MSKLLGRLQTLRWRERKGKASDDQRHHRRSKKGSTLENLSTDGVELEQPPTREQRARWRHSITGYPTLVVPVGTSSDDEETLGGEHEVNYGANNNINNRKHRRMFGADSSGATSGSTGESMNNTRQAANTRPRPRLDRERSRSFSSESSNSFEDLFPMTEAGLCYAWKPEAASKVSPKRKAPDGAGLTIPHLPARRSSDSGVPSNTHRFEKENKVKEKQKEKEKERTKDKDDTPATHSSTENIGRRRTMTSGEDKPRERKRPSRGKSHTSALPASNNSKEEKETGLGSTVSLIVESKSRQGSSDYLWGIVPDTDTSADSDSDSDLMDEHEENEKVQNKKEQDRDRGKEKETAAKDKASKKKRITLRLFSPGQTEPPQPSDASLNHQGASSLSRVVNKFTRGNHVPACNSSSFIAPTSPTSSGGPNVFTPSSPSSSHSSTSLQSSSTSTSISSLQSSISTFSPPTTSQNPHSLSSSASSTISSGASRDIPAASILAAIGSGHFSAFSPAQPARLSDPLPLSPQRGSTSRRHTEYLPPSSFGFEHAKDTTLDDSNIGKASTNNIATRTILSSHAPEKIMRRNSSGESNTKNEIASRSEETLIITETKSATELSSSTEESNSSSNPGDNDAEELENASGEQGPKAPRRRLRPLSCSLEDLLNVADASKSEPDSMAVEPPPAPMTSRVESSREQEPEKEVPKDKAERQSPISMQVRMSMLSNIGGGGTIGFLGSLPSRRSRFYGTLFDTGKISGGTTIASRSPILPRNRSRSGDDNTASEDLAVTNLNTAGSHGRLTVPGNDYDWRKSWSPRLIGQPAPEPYADERSPFHYSYPPSESTHRLPGTGSKSSIARVPQRTLTEMTSSTVIAPTNPSLEVISRGRSNTIGAPTPYSETGGDKRVFNLLEELKLMKYWPRFLQEEILLEDLDGMKEKDLITDFEMTKWHAKRLLRAVERLRTEGFPSELKNSGLLSSSSRVSPFVSSNQVFLPSAPSVAGNAAIATAVNQSGAAIVPHLSDRAPASPLSPKIVSEAVDGNLFSETSTIRSEKRREKKKSKKKKDRKRRKKERERIEKEWEKLRQEREKLAHERLEEAREKGKKSIADLEFRELNVADIEYEDKVLAHGRFGVVYKGRWRGVECALKQLRVDVAAESEESDRLMKAFKKEASLMQALGYHPNCICFFGAVTLGGRLCLVSEWAAHGSVYDLLIKRKKDLPLKTLVKLARDAACGILHLHSEKVIHRDIAARNVLVGQDYTGKISDLGLSRVMTTTITTDSTSSNIGAVKWMSPESITTNEYNEKSDAFSFGVFLWEMVTRETPWGSHAAMQVALMVVNESKRLPIPENCDPVFGELMKKCFATPQERPDFHEIFTTLNNYYKKLEAAEPRQDSYRRIRFVFTDGPSALGNSASSSTSTTASNSDFASAVGAMSNQQSQGPGGDSTQSGSLPRDTNNGTRPLALLPHPGDDTSEDSDSESSSCSSDQEEVEQDKVLQYAHMGDVNNVLSVTSNSKGDRQQPAASSDSDNSDSSDSDDDGDPRRFFPLLKSANITVKDSGKVNALAPSQLTDTATPQPRQVVDEPHQQQRPVEVQ